MKKPSTEYYVYFGSFIEDKIFLKHEKQLNYLYEKKIKNHPELGEFYAFGRNRVSDLCQKIHIISHYTDLISKGFWITSKYAENEQSDFRFGLTLLNLCDDLNISHKTSDIINQKNTVLCGDIYCNKSIENKTTAISYAKSLKHSIKISKTVNEKTHEEKTIGLKKLFKDIYKFDPPKFTINVVTVDPNKGFENETY